MSIGKIYHILGVIMNKIGISDYLLVAYVGIMLSVYHFGFTWDAFVSSMVIANVYVGVVAIIYYLVDKFRK
jgi:hypothetical protein